MGPGGQPTAPSTTQQEPPSSLLCGADLCKATGSPSWVSLRERKRTGGSDGRSPRRLQRLAPDRPIDTGHPCPKVTFLMLPQESGHWSPWRPLPAHQDSVRSGYPWRGPGSWGRTLRWLRAALGSQHSGRQRPTRTPQGRWTEGARQLCGSQTFGGGKVASWAPLSLAASLWPPSGGCWDRQAS
jgi:hypothetical protein